jgi:hypothetical protein
MTQVKEPVLGQFKIGKRWLPGQVTFRGRDSRFEAYSDEFIHVARNQMRCIRGVARSGDAITICDAIGPEVSGRHGRYGKVKHFISLFPHHVAIGPRHLETDKRVISGIIFTTSGATGLFYDIGAFGSAKIKNIRRLMPAWARKDRRKINFSEVFYYIDRGPIISVQLADRHIEVFNGVSWQFPSPRGINMSNEVRLHLRFKKPILLEDALGAAYEFSSFCETVSVTKQVIKNIKVRHKDAAEREGLIDLHQSYEEIESEDKVDFRDNLLSGGFNKKEFEKVLRKWMISQPDHRHARMRVIQGIRLENYYTIDRLVGAANAFDILPELGRTKPALPKKVLKTLATLSDQAANLADPYRGQILSNLNRVKGANLRTKIEARFKSVPVEIRKRMPDIQFVIDACVRSRNYFVHGTKPKLSPDATHDFLSFFTDTLEFIFMASDLALCGWNGERWLKVVNGGRFRDYVRNYEAVVKDLKKRAQAT